MKHVVFLTFMLFVSLVSNSQTENFNEDFIIKFGFNLGLNYSNLFSKENLPDDFKINNSTGFRMGIIMDYKLSKHFVLAPKSELSFNNNSVKIPNALFVSKIFPTSLEFMSYLVYRTGKPDLKPYLFVGPNIKFLVRQKSALQSSYDFAIDFGIGIDKKLEYFVFAPEFRYSYGLLNVNMNPELQSLFFHNVALVLNFK